MCRPIERSTLWYFSALQSRSTHSLASILQAEETLIMAKKTTKKKTTKKSGKKTTKKK